MVDSKTLTSSTASVVEMGLFDSHNFTYNRTQYAIIYAIETGMYNRRRKHFWLFRAETGEWEETEMRKSICL